MTEIINSPKTILIMLMNACEDVRQQELAVSLDTSQSDVDRAEARGSSAAYNAIASRIRDHYLPLVEAAEKPLSEDAKLLRRPSNKNPIQ